MRKDRAAVSKFKRVKTTNELKRNRLTNVIDSGMIPIRSIETFHRRSYDHIFTSEEIEFVKIESTSLGIPLEKLRFNEEFQTSYDDFEDVIFVKGDILPDHSTLRPRGRMSVRAVLAYECYGHRNYRFTKLKEGAWNDEFRASYIASKVAPNLSKQDRIDLVNDALDRAGEAGVSIKYNAYIRRILYGR